MAIDRLGRKADLVADCFAGEGEISKLFWKANANHVLCIEINKRKAERLPDCFDVICDDNRNCIAEISKADIIDCDAYGIVSDFINLLPKNKMVVFTNGTPLKAKKVYTAERGFREFLAQRFSESYVLLGSNKTVYYGWGITK